MTALPTGHLGDTALVVSRVGLGLAALGRPGYINIGHASDLEQQYDAGDMREQTGAVLDAAWAAGVRYFDAARSYGRAEEFLARWLSSRHLTPEMVTVGSKWGYTYTAGWRVDAAQHEVKDHSLATLSRQIAESRAVLGAHLDLYQIHSATLDSGVLEKPPVLRALAQLRGEGLKIGASVSGPRQAETVQRALESRVDGERLFDTIQATWNILEPSAAAALRAAHEAGVGVIVKEGLANGRLTARNIAPAFAPQRRVLDALANDLHTSIDALALGAVLAQPWVDVVLSGAATVAQLESNLTALSLRWDDATAVRLVSLAEPPDDYWSTRSRLPWN